MDAVPAQRPAPATAAAGAATATGADAAAAGDNLSTEPIDDGSAAAPPRMSRKAYRRYKKGLQEAANVSAARGAGGGSSSTSASPAFEEEKQRIISSINSNEPDKSRAGFVDEAAWPVLDAINGLEGVYSTSSCAGRVIVTKQDDSSGYNIEWLYVSHEENALEHENNRHFSAIWEQLRQYAAAAADQGGRGARNEVLWFKLEPPLFAIRVANLEIAQDFLTRAKQCGYKNVALRQLHPSIMININDNLRIETLLARNGDVLVDEAYVRVIVAEAMVKLAKCRAKMARWAAAMAEMQGK